MIDEPWAFDAEALQHVGTCDVCGTLQAAIRRHADFAAGSIGGTSEIDLAAAHGRLESAMYAPQRSARWYMPAALTAAAAFVLALVFTPLGGYASAFLTIFQPKE